MKERWSRRRLLRVAVLGATGTVVTGSMARIAGAQPRLSLDDFTHQLAGYADEYDLLRARWRDLLTGGDAVDPADPLFADRLADMGRTAAGYRAAMVPATASLWPDLPLTESSAVTESHARLTKMALAFASPGTGVSGDPGLAGDVAAGLNHLYVHAYNERTAAFGNWWDWQIGAPFELLDCCVLMFDRLSAAQLANHLRAVDHFVPDPTRMLSGATSMGSTRTGLCQVVAIRGALGSSANKLAAARDALSPVLGYVTSGDGFYADGSFVHHGHVAYTGAYGREALDRLSALFVLLAGSSWEVTSSRRQVLHDAVEKTFAPVLYRGLVMDAVRGRSISRGWSSDHVDGHLVIGSVLRLAQAAEPATADRFRALAKGWIGRDTFFDYFANRLVSVPDLALAKAALADELPAASERVGHWQFPGMDRVVHRRPGWAVAIAMCSKRISYFESISGENLHGWHTGSGMTYAYSAQQIGQYADAFWATVDPYRLPGITVSRKTLADGTGDTTKAPTPTTSWAGGTHDGTYGIAGMDLAGYRSTLGAKKSWFFLDDAVVCLGAGIKALDGQRVESVVDGRNLGASGGVALVVDGVTKPATTGWTEAMSGVRWAHIEGHGGYVLPGGATLKGLRESRTGRWRDVSTAGSTTPITREYVTLWFDHGINPTGATYSYVVLPAATPEATAARAADAGWLEVIANSASKQGIRVASLGITGVNFWTAGSAGPVTVDQAASVMIRERGDGTARLCLSHPPRTAAVVEVTWQRPVTSVTAKDTSVTVLATGSTVRLRIAVGTLGATHRATVTLG